MKTEYVLDGYCNCGCGEQTNIWRKKPRKFVYGHQARGKCNSRFGVKLDDTLKKKISRAQKGKYVGEKNPFYGKKHSNETRQKMSQNHADVNGENNPFYGKRLSEEQKEKMVAGSLRYRSNAPILPTLPEKLVHEQLKKLDVSFNTEVPINNKFCVDIFIPSHNLIIYVDGCYWHACPTHFPKAKKPRTDNARIPYLTKCGYKVELVWEHDIKEDVEEVVKNICKKYNML